LQHLLPTLMKVTGVQFSPAFVCFCTQYFKNQYSQDHQTWQRNVPPWVLEKHLFWDQKVKVTTYKAQKTCWRGFWLLINSRSINN